MLLAGMAALAQIIAHHGCILVLDAASTTVQVGLLRAGFPPLWQSSGEESGQSLFTCADACLRAAGLTVREVHAFVFCEGPGSMLGVRTTAMAIRTWQSEIPRPAYRYQSLALAGHFAWSLQPGRAFAVIADARRETWHCQTVATDGRMPALQRLPLAALPKTDLVTPENFRSWSVPPPSAALCGYDLRKIFPSASASDYFLPTDAPDAFQHEAPDYKKWSARTHSAATVPPR
jgi:tRNA threonylcarbamoyladenosine biosynthesis protein TsaB